MVRSWIYTLIAMKFFFIPITHANTLNTCRWFYSDPYDRAMMIHEVSDRNFAKITRQSIATRQGHIIAYDFIPGSLSKEPVVIDGGLWYQIEFFNTFNLFSGRQNAYMDIAHGLNKNPHSSVAHLIKSGHPIIVVSRATQPESIIAAMQQGLRPSFSKAVTLSDHAKDTMDIVNHLRTAKKIGSGKIQLVSLSYGVTVAVQIAKQFESQISHKHFMAPLSKSGDNFPTESNMQDTMVQTTKGMYSFWKLNPMTTWWAHMASRQSVDFIYSSASKKYSENIVDSSFKGDQNWASLENQYPGIKEIIRKGLQNDIDAARPDRFRLDNPDYFNFFKDATIYLAGDEDPARLKSQLDAYLKIKEKLGSQAPNLIIMDDAQHAITASAPGPTSYFFSRLISAPELHTSDGSLYYMHRSDITNKVIKLNAFSFKLITDEIKALSIGPGIPSILEPIFQPAIFKDRVLFHVNAAKDLAFALQNEQQIPPADYAVTPNRPYERLRYISKTKEIIEAINKEIEAQNKTLALLNEIQEKVIGIVKTLEIPQTGNPL